MAKLSGLVSSNINEICMYWRLSDLFACNRMAWSVCFNLAVCIFKTVLLSLVIWTVTTRSLKSYPLSHHVTWRHLGSVRLPSSRDPFLSSTSTTPRRHFWERNRTSAQWIHGLASGMAAHSTNFEKFWVHSFKNAHVLEGFYGFKNNKHPRQSSPKFLLKYILIFYWVYICNTWQYIVYIKIHVYGS